MVMSILDQTKEESFLRDVAETSDSYYDKLLTVLTVF